MRILLIAGSFPPQRCGVGDYTNYLSRALSRQAGVRVAILADEEVAHGRHDPRVEVFPVARGWRISDIPRIMRVLKDWKPDIVHIQYPTQGFYGPKILPYDLPVIVKCLGRKVVQTWHESFPGNRITILANALVTSRFIVVKPEFTKTMSRIFRILIPSKEFRWIPNAPTIPCVKLTDGERLSLRESMIGKSQYLLAYFGFVYPHKGVEHIFRIANPERHHIVLICDLDPTDEYHRKLLEHVNGRKWSGHVTVTGHLPEPEVGALLCAADAAIFPFTHGAANWNTSIHAATIQGTFVLTTSKERQGFDELGNLYFSTPGKDDEMRNALDRYIGRKNPNPPQFDWEEIAREHLDLYRRIIK